MIKTIEMLDRKVHIIDQRKLPLATEMLDCTTYHQVGEAIKTLAVRGAPAIGVAGAMGMVLAADACVTEDRQHFLAEMQKAYEELLSTRPTAVNLLWGLDRIMHIVHSSLPLQEIRSCIHAEACHIAEEDEQLCRRIGDFGAALVPDGSTILTHCNAGSLATAGYGTALGVIRSAHRLGRKIHVFVDETRPLLQGARLTAWELKEEGIPFTLITDNMAGHFMKKGDIDLVITGADRIAANGDTANKIGTYSVAVLAKEHSLPFYIAAPYSTVDMHIASGEEICIEERNSSEVTSFGGVPVAPPGINVANPAFDVTPHRYISAIITDRGIINPPFGTNLTAAMKES